MPQTTVHIYADDDMERMAVLRREVDVAERHQAVAAVEAVVPRRMGDDEPDPVRLAREKADEAKAAFDAFVDEASERAEAWVLHSIGHEEWRDLLLAHPPRKVAEGEGESAKEVDHPDDEPLGLNTQTFGKALLTFVDPEDPDIRTVMEPSLTAAALSKRLKRLSAGQFESLWVTAYYLNVGGVADPKLARFSPDAQRSPAT